ncbi:hypothetical protein Mgra_00006658 [Meloidogyne graminicola]|uniref:Uncharacterized protein n=1 Tax=Meloidogyne graminicola TaxID=189291 RepID=A0A8S9ZL03_9BILA|nr:hypothetical protein Mgra_00006658 [Meloidogyne graminicola]
MDPMLINPLLDNHPCLVKCTVCGEEALSKVVRRPNIYFWVMFIVLFLPVLFSHPLSGSLIVTSTSTIIAQFVEYWLESRRIGEGMKEQKYK